MAAPATGPGLDEVLTIETAEQVTLSVPVAGLSVRALAALVDHLLLGLVLGVLWLLMRFALPQGTDLGEALIIAVMSALYLGGFLAVEFFSHGTTPGKRMLHLRAANADGSLPTPAQILIRNLLRPADVLLTLLGIELFILFWTPRSQRLGDLAAGTIVIRERTTRLSDVAQAIERQQFLQQGAVAGGQFGRQWSSADRELVRRFLERAVTLPADRRVALADQICQRLETQYGTVPALQGLASEERLRRMWGGG